MKYTVGPEEEGRRIREILRRSMGLSYSALKKVKWHGQILLDGEPVHADATVCGGQTVEARWPEENPAYPVKPYFLPLKVPYLDEYLMIVDKPAPLASQSSRNHPDDSLENAVFAYLGCPAGFVFRLVNRLDRGTSGLMVIARSAYAQHRLQEQLHTDGLRRRYLALTEGCPEAERGILDFPIARIGGATVKRQVTPEGKPSRTRYRVLSREPEGRALVLLELETGRTHQIRVHLSHIGCPVAGDFLYGQELPEAFPGRFALHSAWLSLTHPAGGERITLVSLPEWAAGKGLEKAVLSMDPD